MEHTIIILAFATLFCVVQSQLCVTSGAVPQIIASTPLVSAPQAINTPVVTTTIIDNSVSAALANALQLLIASNIETKLGEPCLSNLINLNTIETPCNARVEVLQPIAEYVSPIAPCSSTVEIISPFRPVIESYPYLGAEIVSPNFGFTANCNPYLSEIVNPCLSNVYLPDVVTTRNYNVAEFLSPNLNPYNGCGVEVISPPSICGTEIVNIPSYNNGCFRGYNELVTPIPYNSCGDIAIPFNPCGVTEVISSRGSYYGGIPEVIAPISSCNSGCFGNNIADFITPFNTFGGISEIITPGCGIAEVIQPYYGGFPEVISPIYQPGCAGLPELLPNNPFGPCREIIRPCTNFPEVIIPNQCNTGCSGCGFCGPAFTPNFCGVNEIVNPVGSFAPIAAEVLIPSSIPAQLTCNFGYSPFLGPCVNFDVEPLPFGSGFCY